MKAFVLAAALGRAEGFGTSLGMVHHSGHVAVNTTTSFGTDVLDGVGVEAQFPMNENELKAKGWFKYSKTCDPLLGWAWSGGSGGVQESKPVTLYTTSGGEISGVGMRFYGEVKKKLLDAGFFRNDNQLDVAFRGDPCSDKTPAPAHGVGVSGLGDRLIVAPHGAKREYPVSEPKGYRGSWFNGMGWHYFEDLTWTKETYGAALTWRAENLAPVVTMYDDAGKINAIFFASATRQQTLFPPRRNMWDAIPLPTPLMCQNFCTKDCQWHDSWGFSTGHIYFNPTKTGPTAKTPAGLKCGLPGGVSCCATKDIVV